MSSVSTIVLLLIIALGLLIREQIFIKSKSKISIIQLVKAYCYFVLVGRRWNSGLTSLYHESLDNKTSAKPAFTSALRTEYGPFLLSLSYY